MRQTLSNSETNTVLTLTMLRSSNVENSLAHHFSPPTSTQHGAGREDWKDTTLTCVFIKMKSFSSPLSRKMLVRKASRRASPFVGIRQDGILLLPMA